MTLDGFLILFGLLLPPPVVGVVARRFSVVMGALFLNSWVLIAMMIVARYGLLPNLGMDFLLVLAAIYAWGIRQSILPPSRHAARY